MKDLTCSVYIFKDLIQGDFLCRQHHGWIKEEDRC